MYLLVYIAFSTLVLLELYIVVLIYSEYEINKTIFGFSLHPFIQNPLTKLTWNYQTLTPVYNKPNTYLGRYLFGPNAQATDHQHPAYIPSNP